MRTYNLAHSAFFAPQSSLYLSLIGSAAAVAREKANCTQILSSQAVYTGHYSKYIGETS